MYPPVRIWSVFRDEWWTGQRNPIPALHPNDLVVGYVGSAQTFLKVLNLRYMLGCIEKQHIQPQENSNFSLKWRLSS